MRTTVARATTTVTRAAAAPGLLLTAPAPLSAHPGEGPAGPLHDLLHVSLLGADHALRPAGVLLLLLGAGVLLAATRADGAARRAALRRAGRLASLAGLALTLA